MARLVLLLCFVLYFGVGLSQISTARPTTREARRSREPLPERFFSFFRNVTVKVGNTTRDLFNITLEGLRIYKENISTILPNCMQAQQENFDQLQADFAVEIQNCFYYPFSRTSGDIRSALMDLQNMITLLPRVFFDNFKDVFGMVLDFWTQEGSTLNDLGSNIRDAFQTDYNPQGIPLCIYYTTVGVAYRFLQLVTNIKGCVTINLTKAEDLLLINHILNIF